MKKSTLISTLAMVVIVALALTTATFAWYSANTKVTAQTTATAATATGSNLSIRSEDGLAQTSLDLEAVSQMTPAAPTGDWSKDLSKPTGSSSTEIKALLKTATVDADKVFTSDPSDATVLAADFYIKNDAESGAAAIVPKVTLTAEASADEGAADGKDILRVAIFVITTNKGTTTWTYKATLARDGGSSTDVTFGTIVKGESSNYTTAENTTQIDKYTATTSTVLDSLSAGAETHIGIVAWFDGNTLVNGNSGAACKFTLTFEENK